MSRACKFKEEDFGRDLKSMQEVWKGKEFLGEAGWFPVNMGVRGDPLQRQPQDVVTGRVNRSGGREVSLEVR